MVVMATVDKSSKILKSNFSMAFLFSFSVLFFFCEYAQLHESIWSLFASFSRMESTEKCEVVIQHFNGKYLKTPPGIPGKKYH